MIKNKLQARSNLRIFGGSSHPALAKAVARKCGVNLGEVHSTKFANNKISVDLKENVRGQVSTYQVNQQVFDRNWGESLKIIRQEKVQNYLAEKIVKFLRFCTVDNFDLTKKKSKNYLPKKIVKVHDFLLCWQLWLDVKSVKACLHFSYSSIANSTNKRESLFTLKNAIWREIFSWKFFVYWVKSKPTLRFDEQTILSNLVGTSCMIEFRGFSFKSWIFFFIFSKDIYVIQTGGGMKPNDDLMELMFLINAFK